MGKDLQIPLATASTPHSVDLTEETHARLVKALQTPIVFHGMLNSDGSLDESHRALITGRKENRVEPRRPASPES